MLNSHSRTYHPGRPVLSPGQQDTVVEPLVDSGYRTSATELYTQTPGQKPVDGLMVLEGFLCPLSNEDGSLCSRAFGAQSTFSRHLSDHREPQESKPTPSLCSSYVQTLFNRGGLVRYFSVDPSLSHPDPLPTSAYAHAIDMFRQLPKPEMPTAENDKERASIHWFTRWPQLLQPYFTDKTSIAHLQSLVSFPNPTSDPDWLMKLIDHGPSWWADAEEAHMSCSHRVSVMLKSHRQ
jgi:hypothetical protein